MNSLSLDARFAEICAMEGPLSMRLQAFDRTLHEMGLPSAKAYDNLVTTLRTAGAAKSAPSVGDRMPSFLLPDADGHLVDLASLLGERRLVISFNRGHWCQFCQLELAAFANAHREFSENDANVVTILPERLQYIRDVRERAGGKIIALSDMDNGYALELALVVWVGAEVMDVYKSIGWDLNKFQGNDMWFVPVPATFVVDNTGFIIARHIDPDFRKRMEINDVLAALR